MGGQPETESAGKEGLGGPAMKGTSEKRIIVITGAGSGIGLACAKRLATTGTEIIALDRDRSAASETVRLVETVGASGRAIECDVTRRDMVDEAFRTVGHTDVLVNSAGVFGEKSLEDITADDLRYMYEVNAVGLFSVSQVALKGMSSGGKIVNIGSRAYLGSLRHAHYVASKAAVVGLTRTMAIELLSREISVNTVAPGVVRTPMVAGLPEKRLADIAAGYPGGRIPEAEDIAQAVAFFADPLTRFITGQVLIIDGGRSLGGSSA